MHAKLIHDELQGTEWSNARLKVWNRSFIRQLGGGVMLCDEDVMSQSACQNALLNHAACLGGADMPDGVPRR